MPLRKKAGAKHRKKLPISPVLLAGAVSLAATAAGVGWRILRPKNSEDTPESVVSFTAASVTNASRKQLLEAADGLTDPSEVLDAIRGAALSVVRQAADAGADIVPAAVGAVQGARIVARGGSIAPSDAVAAATEGAITAATELTAAAAERVSEALHTLEGVKPNRA